MSVPGQTLKVFSASAIPLCHHERRAEVSLLARRLPPVCHCERSVVVSLPARRLPRREEHPPCNDNSIMFFPHNNLRQSVFSCVELFVYR